ncbi:MAG: hypothetical protein COU08_04450 [Candidatus Harrisonbacteria bacterium CG10_big_fil_rev_8_21_14_0_10_42_17]|uniref:Uncharacterized protein n=1 Tax=Candidatus Harrisonbacteria bacterium CG10_big_fil_rev_8_21_14_0_10_42_17 TaxID=1974584 RepID=A0A2M6WH63_9BACT|nr:MAG: hypothetical protein COU08_04450 [Candidatus Harrisonbacteria bacterium CG10_big_fil_rev_8_21_14_0_10_42_17]
MFLTIFSRYIPSSFQGYFFNLSSFQFFYVYYVYNDIAPPETEGNHIDQRFEGILLAIWN